MEKRTIVINVPRTSVLIALIIGLLVIPTAVFAGHQFTDVPDDNIFHDDIDAIADAGVTRGCNPPDNDEYCPEDFVTREQMAAFMNRLGALESGTDPVVNAAAVQGLELLSDIAVIDVSNEEGNNEECESVRSIKGAGHEFGTFYVSYELFHMPAAGDLFTFDVNVATRAPDNDSDHPELSADAPGDYLVCFATLEDQTLPDGEYRLFRIEAHESDTA